MVWRGERPCHYRPLLSRPLFRLLSISRRWESALAINMDSCLHKNDNSKNLHQHHHLS